MRIVSWNVNSIRARLPQVETWLRDNRPEVVLLQEIKCMPETFPLETIEALGYSVVLAGQKTFNGVAILSRVGIEDVVTGLPSYHQDPQARYIEAVVGGCVRVASVYVPNGQSVTSDKFAYKHLFLENLRTHLAHLLSYQEMCVVGGDYNIAPEDRDVAKPQDWEGHVLFTEGEKAHFRSLLHLGYSDALRLFHPEGGLYSWWDYRSGSWEKGEGLRIDHLLLSPQAAEAAVDAGIDKAPRGLEKASDHVPVWCDLELKI